MGEYDLVAHLLRQMAWSHATFGPGPRVEGVSDHIRKELHEVALSDGSLEEWIDVVILALDGATRAAAFTTEDGKRRDPERAAWLVIHALKSKQARNEARVWPDWRTMDPEKAIEHDRSHDE